MSLFFWLLWIVNLCFIIVIMYANSFSSHQSPGLDMDKMVMIGLGLALISSIIVRYAMKQPKISLWIVGVPLVIMGIWYVVEKVQKAVKKG